MVLAAHFEAVPTTTAGPSGTSLAARIQRTEAPSATSVLLPEA